MKLAIEKALGRLARLGDRLRPAKSLRQITSWVVTADTAMYWRVVTTVHHILKSREITPIHSSPHAQAR